MAPQYKTCLFAEEIGRCVVYTTGECPKHVNAKGRMAVPMSWCEKCEYWQSKGKKTKKGKEENG